MTLVQRGGWWAADAVPSPLGGSGAGLARWMLGRVRSASKRSNARCLADCEKVCAQGGAAARSGHVLRRSDCGTTERKPCDAATAEQLARAGGVTLVDDGHGCRYREPCHYPPVRQRPGCAGAEDAGAKLPRMFQTQPLPAQRRTPCLTAGPAPSVTEAPSATEGGVRALRSGEGERRVADRCRIKWREPDGIVFD